MNLEIVNVNDCKKHLVAEVPVEELDQEINRLARQYAQQAKVPGFRPGKVPLHIIKQRFGEELRNDATQDIIQRSWKDAIAQNKLQPLAEPVVENIQSDPGNPLKFTVAFEVMPELEVKNYRGIPVQIQESKIEESDVDKALEQLREQHAQFIPVEGGEIHDGHAVSLTLNGTFADGGKPVHDEEATLIIGDPRTEESFSENLRGAKQGDLRSFDISYPENYHRKRFAGKTVHYEVQVREIKEKQLPELTDEWAVDLGLENLAALKARISDDLVTNAKHAAEEKAREDAVNQLVESHKFDIPVCLVQEELQDYARRIASNLAHQGIDVSKTSIDWRKIFEEDRPRAEQAVRRSIVLNAVARQEGLDVSEEELEAELRKVAETTNKSVEAIRAQLEKDERIQEFTAHLRRNKTLDFIYRNANISGG